VSFTEKELEESFPAIAWREPLPVTIPGIGSGLACRLCIAMYGLAGKNVKQLPQTSQEFDEHMALLHAEVTA